MPEQEIDVPGWISDIKNTKLFKAAANLASVRNACAGSDKETSVGLFEMKMLSEALAALVAAMRWGQNTTGPMNRSSAGVKVVQTSRPTIKQIAITGPV